MPALLLICRCTVVYDVCDRNVYYTTILLCAIDTRCIMSCTYTLVHTAKTELFCSFNKDLCRVSCTCVTMSIHHSQVLHNHNIFLVMWPQYSPKQQG